MAQSNRPEEPEETKRSFREWLSTYSGYISFILVAVGGVAFVGGGILFLLIRDIRTFSLAVVIIGIVLMIAALLLSPNRVYTALIGRRGRYGTNTFIMTASFLFIAGLLNFLFFDIITFRGDVTATKQFSLAPQTTQILKDLPEPIMAHAFFVLTLPEEQIAWTSMSDLLEEYKKRAKNKFDYELIDLQEQPSKARNFNASTSGTIVFEALDSGRRQAILTSAQVPAQEQDVTGALLAVTGVKQKVVYLLEGHDEHSFRDLESEDGYGVATRGLFADNYAIRSLNLLQTGEVPPDVAVLIIAGPKKELRQEETDALDNYLLDGGRALFLMDPESPQTFRDLLADWGVKVGEGTIVDPISSLATDERTPLISPTQYVLGSPIPIVDVLKSPSLFPDVTSIDMTMNPDDLPAGMLFVPLAFTSPGSWLETDPDENNFDPTSDTIGPLFIAASVITDQPLREGATPSNKLTRLVVFGDSDFPSNFFYSYNSNGDFMLNSVNWLTEDVSLISIRPKPIAFRQLFLTQRERDFIQWSSWLLIPGFITLLGVVVWWRRR